ncbi:hypothetical protein [Gordonia humi]|uniref:Uncharacterized protein n=1 Tax=Gordonia humi TaxID=686429 RepID=A0A840EWL0_9ACTN|nr:hypothetical protein [Gordonia humi]MBB4134694.1 hypothetical protein [Gordonia humi]
MKQTLGFALFGGLLAVLATAVVDGGSSLGWTAYTPMTSRVVDSAGLGLERPVLNTALIGVVVGGMVGAALRLAGVVTAGPPQNRITRVVAAGLVGAAVGVGLGVGVAFGGVFDDVPGTTVVLAMYAGCGLLAYLLSLAMVAAVLRASDDDLIRPTVLASAWMLVVGGALATAAGTGTAWCLGFTTTESTWTATIIVVLIVVSAALAVARGIALRSRATSAPPHIPPNRAP